MSASGLWGIESWKKGLQDDSLCAVEESSDNGARIVAKTTIPAGSRIIKEEASLLIPPFDFAQKISKTSSSTTSAGSEQQNTPSSSNLTSEELNTEVRLHTLRSLLKSKESKKVVEGILSGLCQPSFAGGIGKEAVDKAVETFLQEEKPSPESGMNDMSLLTQVLLAIDCNAHSVREQDVASRAVFPTVCKLNHSCRANCLFFSSCTKEGDIVAEVQVIRDVKAGEELLLNYLPVDYFTMANRQRQAHLLQSKYFSCKCKEICGAPSGSDGGEDTRRQITVLGDYLESSKSKEKDLEDKTEQMLSGIRQGIISNADLSLAFEACLATLGQKHWCSLTLGVFKCMRSYGALLMRYQQFLQEQQQKGATKSDEESGAISEEKREQKQQKFVDEVHESLVDFLLCYSELRAQDTPPSLGAPSGSSSDSAVASLEFWMTMTGPISMFASTLLDSDVNPLSLASASTPLPARLVATLSTFVISITVHLLDARKMFGADGSHYQTMAGHWKRFVPKIAPILMAQVQKLTGTKIESSDGSAELSPKMYSFFEEKGLTKGESMVERGLLVPLHVGCSLELAMPLPVRSARNLLLVPAVAFLAADADDEDDITKDSDATSARLLLLKILLGVQLTKYTQPYGQRAMEVLKPALSRLSARLESHSLKMLELVSPANEECAQCREFLISFYEWRVENVYLNVVGHPAGAGEADKVAKAVKKDGAAYLKSVMSSLVENKSRNAETKKMIEAIRGLIQKVKE